MNDADELARLRWVEQQIESQIADWRADAAAPQDGWPGQLGFCLGQMEDILKASREPGSPRVRDGHELAREQIEKHGKDRYPSTAQQLMKLVEECGELCGALLKNDLYATAEVRGEYADAGLALYELGNKLGLNLIEEMARLVDGDTRSFRGTRWKD